MEEEKKNEDKVEKEVNGWFTISEDEVKWMQAWPTGRRGDIAFVLVFVAASLPFWSTFGELIDSFGEYSILIYYSVVGILGISYLGGVFSKKISHEVRLRIILSNVLLCFGTLLVRFGGTYALENIIIGISMTAVGGFCLWKTKFSDGGKK